MPETKAGDLRTLAVRVSPDFHAQLSMVAQVDEMTLVDLMVTALDNYLAQRREAPEFKAKVQAALEEAELMAACRISEAFTGIAGSHIKSFNSSGMVAIKDREVTPVSPLVRPAKLARRVAAIVEGARRVRVIEHVEYVDRLLVPVGLGERIGVFGEV